MRRGIGARVDFEPLEPADITEVMRIERLPGYDAVVGRWEAEVHAAEMASPGTRYFGVRERIGLAGFVILQEVEAPTVVLRRLAVDKVERGTGTRLVRAAMDWIFQRAGAEAVALGVALGNPRARHVYEREGFRQYAADEMHHLMKAPRSAWLARRAG